MSQRVYVLGSKSFDPMWEEAYADASRTDTYLNVYDACVLKFVVGGHIWKKCTVSVITMVLATVT